MFSLRRVIVRLGAFKKRLLTPLSRTSSITSLSLLSASSFSSFVNVSENTEQDLRDHEELDEFSVTVDIDHDKTSLLLSAKELSDEFDGITYLAEIVQTRLAIAPAQLSQVGFEAGELLCSQWEGQLSQLEAAFKDYIKDFRSNRIPSKYDIKQTAKYYDPIEAALKSYKDLLLDIITQQASRADKQPSVEETPFWHGQKFAVKPSPTCKIIENLSISPGCDDVTSKTIYSEPDHVPALVVYENKETLRNYGTPGNAFGSSNGCIGYELSSQMSRRRHSDVQLLTHQGLMLDGLRATVFFMDLSKPGDAFKPHRTSFGHTFYALPNERATFVHHMVELLRSHERHFEIFKYITGCEVYDHDEDNLQVATVKRLGKIGPPAQRACSSHPRW